MTDPTPAAQQPEPLDLAAARAICAAATAGPWEVLRDPDDVDNTTIRTPAAWFEVDGHRQYGVRFVAELAEGNLTEADAEFIAAARTLLPRALDELAQARADLAAANARANGWRGSFGDPATAGWTWLDAAPADGPRCTARAGRHGGRDTFRCDKAAGHHDGHHDGHHWAAEATANPGTNDA